MMKKRFLKIKTIILSLFLFISSTLISSCKNNSLSFISLSSSYFLTNKEYQDITSLYLKNNNLTIKEEDDVYFYLYLDNPFFISFSIFINNVPLIDENEYLTNSYIIEDCVFFNNYEVNIYLKNGKEIYSLKEAYDNELITRNDIITIFFASNPYKIINDEVALKVIIDKTKNN